jgi:hypothetical protein
MWNLTNRRFAEKHYTHFVYFSGDQIAIADHSIRNLSDPSSTDDGLLLVDDSRPAVPVKPKLFCDGNYFIPVITDKGEQSTVIAPLHTVQLIRLMTVVEERAND